MSDTSWDPETYQTVADFVAKLGEPLIKLLAPKPTDIILDVGCGDGSLSAKVLPLCRTLVGVDSSPQMIEAAIERGINGYVKDAQHLDFNEHFDSVLSNAALHWMKSPEAVLSGIFKALKPGGVFVAEFGGLGNADKIVVALEHALNKRDIAFNNPWYFPSAEEYSTLLTQQGFIIEHIKLFERFTPLPQHLSHWILTFAQSFLRQTSATQSKEIINEVVNEIRDDLYADQQWHVDYVRLRLKAIRPS